MAGQDIVIMTGPAGAGRTTAIRALEDLGFEAIDNLPLSLLPRLFAGPPIERPLVVGRRPAQPRLRGGRGCWRLLDEIGAQPGALRCWSISTATPAR